MSSIAIRNKLVKTFEELILLQMGYHYDMTLSPFLKVYKNEEGKTLVVSSSSYSAKMMSAKDSGNRRVSSAEYVMYEFSQERFKVADGAIHFAFIFEDSAVRVFKTTNIGGELYLSPRLWVSNSKAYLCVGKPDGKGMVGQGEDCVPDYTFSVDVKSSLGDSMVW